MEDYMQELICRAADDGDYDTVKALVEGGASVNSIDQIIFL